MDKLFGFLKKEKFSSKSKLEIPKFSSLEIKEIKQNIRTFTNKEAQQYVLSTLNKHKEFESLLGELQEPTTPRKRHGSQDSKPPDLKKNVLGGSAGPSFGRANEKISGSLDFKSSPLCESQAEQESSSESTNATSSTKARPSGGSLKRVDNNQLQTITKKESMNQASLNARIQGANLQSSASREDIVAALKVLDPSFKSKEGEAEVEDDIDDDDADAYGTMRVKSGDDAYGTMRIFGDDEGDDECGTVRLSKTSQTDERSNEIAKGFVYREPEIWEQNIVALTRGEWSEGMADEAFKRWRGKERPVLGDVFSTQN